mmetsp:Transcript_16272/g.37557  ORF Transcript_16272/g.37557 Transcript_16272/m.37557 type:complete len:727 (-) Transcript_16272:40-2220(-)
MGILKRKRPKVSTDVQLEDGSVPGCQILEHIYAKGYCIVDAGLDPSLIQKALSEVDELDRPQSSLFMRPSTVVQSGLLGAGSALISTMVDESLPAELEEAPSSPSALAMLDGLMSEVVWPPDATWGDELRLGMRSPGLLHLSGKAAVDEPTMTDEQIEDWLDTFRRQRLVSCMCLGPSSGILELTALSGDDPVEVLVEPGVLALWLPHRFQPELRVNGRAAALTSFFGFGGRHANSKQGQPVLPVVQELREMQIQRLRELKVLQETGDGPPIAAGWATRLKHEVFAGQAIAVRGSACHFPGAWNVETWNNMMLGGCDLVTEVPLSRWEHAVHYDPDPESWQNRKIFTNHGSFMDGIELFDHRAFSIAEREAIHMDPSQRHVLEVAYEALLSAGQQKETLLGRACGCYVGYAMPEWGLERERGGQYSFTGMTQTVASNRISYCLGIRGPSMTIDTEQASSLTAMYMASESILQKGKALPCEMSVACGVSLMLSPTWWVQCCADGWFSRNGRAACFDAGADGYIRADASAGLVVKPIQGYTPGICMIEDDEPDSWQGMIAGAMLNNSGKNSRLNMPDAVSEQGVLLDALVAAALAPEDVDSVEAFAPAIPLHDAVEASAINRAYAARDREYPLYITSGKSACGHSLDCSGVQLFIKNLRSIYHTSFHPQLHLGTLNPHVAYQMTDDVHIATEPLTYRMESAFFACKARGFGGVNVAIIGWNRAQWADH